MTPPRLRAHVYEYHRTSIAFIALIASPRAPVIQIKSNQRARAFFLCPKRKRAVSILSPLATRPETPSRSPSRPTRASRGGNYFRRARSSASTRGDSQTRERPRTRGSAPGGAARRCRRARGRGAMRALDEEEGARTASRGETTSSRGYEGILRAERAAARERGMEMRRRNAPGGNGQQGRDDLEGDAREERWRESERGRGSSTFASFDERLARTRARAESAREDAVRIERWLRERSSAAPNAPAAIAEADEQLFMDEDARDGARRMEAVYQRSPTRSVIHRPIPSRPLSSSVEGTGWTKTRTSGTTFREFGTAHSVRSEENSRSAFQSLSLEQPTGRLGDVSASATGISRAQASSEGGVSTPPRIQRSPARPPRVHPRVRTRSEDFTAMSTAPVRVSADLMRNSTSSRMTMLESVAHEAENERAIRLSEVSEDSADRFDAFR